MFHTKHPFLVYGSGAKDLYASREQSRKGMKAVSQSGVTTLGSG